jgi:hypothetical protein
VFRFRPDLTLFRQKPRPGQDVTVTTTESVQVPRCALARLLPGQSIDSRTN